MNYNRADNTGEFNTPGVLLTDAVMFALGGSHLELGDHMLCKEYFPNDNLEMDEESGLFRLKSALTGDDVRREIPHLAGLAPHEPKFMLEAEISSIYKKNGAVRKIHSLVYVPDFESADRLCEKLEAVRPNFDDDTFKSFLSSLESSGILNMIQEKRLSASSVATGAPVIIASGLVSGKATWRIEFPLIVSYESSQGVESTQRLIATVLVCRASTATTPRGVVIQQVVLKRES